MARLLVVDDELRIREIIKKYAEFEGHEVVEAIDGTQAVGLCSKEDFDLIIMDIMMPRMDGFSAYKEIKKQRHIPVIFLSARKEEYDRLHGFELGGEDYVVKPFSPRELMMRVKVILNRAEPGQVHIKDGFVLNSLVIDFAGMTVSIDGSPVDLAPKEYDLLFFLVKNKNIALPRERIIAEVWGADFFGNERTLDTHIKMLRKSLGSYSEHIVTLRGVGYRFDV